MILLRKTLDGYSKISEFQKKVREELNHNLGFSEGLNLIRTEKVDRKNAGNIVNAMQLDPRDQIEQSCIFPTYQHFYIFHKRMEKELGNNLTFYESFLNLK